MFQEFHNHNQVKATNNKKKKKIRFAHLPQAAA